MYSVTQPRKRTLVVSGNWGKWVRSVRFVALGPFAVIAKVVQRPDGRSVELCLPLLSVKN